MTYTAFVLVESLKHRRTIFANTRSKLAEMVINEDIRNFIKSTSLYGTHGGFLYDEHNAGRIIDLFKWAYENGVATFIDPSEDPEQQILDSLRPILKYLKVFIPGYKEALLLTGTDDVVDAARILLSYGPEIVVVKLSQEGSLVVTKSELYYSQGFIVDDKDLTGAGDGFASGFFHGILKGWSLIDSITFGNAYAANNIMHLGPRAGMVSEKETFEFIKRFKSHRHNKIQKFTDYFNDK
jgi:sugar/nucleoside kinase (ribokinase family)